MLLSAVITGASVQKCVLYKMQLQPNVVYIALYSAALLGSCDVSSLEHCFLQLNAGVLLIFRANVTFRLPKNTAWFLILTSVPISLLVVIATRILNVLSTCCFIMKAWHYIIHVMGCHQIAKSRLPCSCCNI